MENLEEENVNIKHIIIKTIAGTFGLAVVCLIILMYAVITFSPRSTIDFFDGIGERNVSYAIYQKIYEKSENNEDLYNVLNRAINNEQYKDVEKYCLSMLDADDEFFVAVDNATLIAVGKKNAVYMSSYKSYVKANLIRADYKLNKVNRAKELAVLYLNNGDANAMLEYIYEVKNDKKLDENQKNSLINILKDEGVIQVANALLSSEALDVSKVKDDFEVAVILNTRIKLNEIQYYIIKTFDEDSANQIQLEIKNMVSSLTALVSTME